MIILAPTSGTFWRDMDFAPNGDIYLRRGNDVVAHSRTGGNSLSGSRFVQDNGTNGNFIAIQNVAYAGVEGGLVFWNDRFHLAIGEIADNQYLMPSLRRLLIDHARIGQTFWRARNAEMRQRIETAADQHDRLIDAIEAGDEETAVALTLDHWALSRDHMEMFVRPDPLPIPSGFAAAELE